MRGESPHCPAVSEQTAKIPPGTGKRIKERRLALGLTQAQVADRVAGKVERKYRENWLAQIERGKASLYLDAAIAVADVLTMSLDEMFGRTAYRGADKVLEATDEATPPLDADLAPVESLSDAAAGRIRPSESPRGHRTQGARPRRT